MNKLVDTMLGYITGKQNIDNSFKKPNGYKNINSSKIINNIKK